MCRSIAVHGRSVRFQGGQSTPRGSFSSSPWPFGSVGLVYGSGFCLATSLACDGGSVQPGLTHGSPLQSSPVQREHGRWSAQSRHLAHRSGAFLQVHPAHPVERGEVSLLAPKTPPPSPTRGRPPPEQLGVPVCLNRATTAIVTTAITGPAPRRHRNCAATRPQAGC